MNFTFKGKNIFFVHYSCIHVHVDMGASCIVPIKQLCVGNLIILTSSSEDMGNMPLMRSQLN